MESSFLTAVFLPLALFVIMLGMGLGLTVAIAIASAPTFLNTPSMAIPAAIYSLLMFVVSGMFAWWSQRQVRFET